MKKIKFFALAALFGMSINAMAQEQSNDTYTYTITGDEATLTGFVNDLSASKMATVTIPASVKGKDGKTYPVVYVDGTASESTKFQENTNIKKVMLASGSNLKGIAYQSFQGASNLATVTLTNGSKLESIGDAAFDGTAIKTLDLTPTKLTYLGQIFSGVSKNKKLTTVKLPASLENIGSYAFANCMQLATVDFSKCNKDLTIWNNAFDNCLFFKELELPACVARIKDYAFEGSRIETLTINANSGAGKPTIGAMGGSVKTIVVNGAFQGVFGLDDMDLPVTVSSSVTSVTFNGAVKAGAIAEGAFVEAFDLANVTFNGLLATDAVAAGAFSDGADLAGKNVKNSFGVWVGLNVTYAPEESAAAKTKPFNKQAFWDVTTTDKKATLTTSTWYANFLAPVPFGLVLSAAPETATIEVANNGSGKYYYATFYADGNYKIAAEQNDGKVMVYSAYVDETKNGNSWSNQVYMEQLTLYGGFYWIPAGAPVIVKSTTSDDVIATLASNNAGFTSMHFDSNLDPTNAIISTSDPGLPFGDEDIYGVELKEWVADNIGAKFVPYILAPIDEYGILWSKFKDERVIPAGSFFIVANNDAVEYARVIWTDGSEEEATAIKTVKNANAENGAKFNLAGQKVNAAYKGIIIKDGKKMIQK